MTDTTTTSIPRENLLTYSRLAYSYDIDDIEVIPTQMHVLKFTSLDESMSYNLINSDSKEAFGAFCLSLNPEDKYEGRFNKWAERGNNESPLRAHMVNNGSDDIGYINFGVSLMKDANGNDIYEGGVKFAPGHASEAASAINSGFVDYPIRLHEDGILPGGLCIYTIATSNPDYQAFKMSSLAHLGAGKIGGEFGLDNNGEFSPKAEFDAKFGPCVSEILAANAKRFTVGNDDYDNVLESGVPKAVFYNLLDESLCVGEVPADTTAPEL